MRIARTGGRKDWPGWRRVGIVSLAAAGLAGVAWAQEAEPAKKTKPVTEEMLFADFPTVYAAARHEQKVSQAPAAVTVITRDDIRKYHYRTLGDAMASVPGIYISNDRVYEHIGVRGVGMQGDFNERVLFLLNGLPINDKYYGNFISEMTPDMLDAVERIEVVKGPASPLFGSNAIFATINIVTRRGVDLDGHAVVSAEGNTDPTGRGVFTYGNMLKNGLDLFVSGHYETGEGESRMSFSEFGKVQDADSQQLSDVFASARYQDFFFQTWYADRTKEMATGEYGAVIGDDTNEVRDSYYVAEGRWAKKFDVEKSLMVRGYYEDYSFDGTYLYSDSEDTDRSYNKDRTRDRWAGFETQFNWQPVEQHLLTFGAVYEHHWTRLSGYYDNTDGVRSINYPGTSEDFSFAGVYVQDEYRIIKPLAVTAGVRYDKFTDSGADHFSPRVAVVWNATDETTLKVIYGQAFRAPSVYERTYAVGAGNAETETDVQPETIDSYEGVLEHDFGHGLTARLSAFHNDMHDLIGTQVFTSEETDIRNLYEASVTGVEAELNKRFKNGVRCFANATWQDARTDDDQRLINSPRWIANAGLVVPIIGDKLAASVRQTYLSDRATRESGETTQEALRTNFTLSSENALPNWSFFFTVYNLFNNHYDIAAGYDGTLLTIPQRGRVFMLRASYKF
ncbi:MAG: TonB-dependent receptor [Verrucomicrobia bacterium]|nr:TonB-dependent receptor [Verrucomicrobiota bacterium]